MDTGPKSPPLVFANRMIRQLIDHLLGSDVIATKDHYLAIRTVFRSLGGSWSQLVSGHIDHVRLLTQIVLGWGGLPGRKREVDEVYDD